MSYTEGPATFKGMSYMRHEPKQKAPRGSSQGARRPVDDARIGGSQSRLAHGADGGYGLIQGEDIAESLSLGDILVDVDAGPGGTGLVVWIMGG